MFVLQAEKTKLTVLERDTLTSGAKNAFKVRFVFSPDWDGLEKTAVFQYGGCAMPAPVDEDECVIPPEVLSAAGRPLMAGVFGTSGEDTVLPTIWVSLGTVQRGASASGAPSLSKVLEELEKKGDGLKYDGLNLLLMSGDKPLSTVQISGGEGGAVPVPGPPGPTGPTGADGKDGVSPTVETAPNAQGDGTIVTITDVNGPHKIEVLNGLDGEDGKPGADGPQGNPGQGLGPGGTTGQMLVKASDKDFDTRWVDVPLGGGSSGGGLPAGCIVIWSGTSTEVPDGWALCDGENGTPDLRGRFVLGQSNNHVMGETGGSETVALTEEQLPAHRHEQYIAITGVNGVGYMAYGSNGAESGRSINTDLTTLNNTGNRVSSKAVGENEPHPNMPPYYVLAYIMKL